MNEIRLYWWELQSMPEYSTSTPTGRVVWKQWRARDRDSSGWLDSWFVGQYVPGLTKSTLTIRWSRVVLRHGPMPPVYYEPDWHREGYYDIGGFDHGQKYDHTAWDARKAARA